MACCEEFFVMSVALLLILIASIFSKNPQPILNVYQRRNGFFELKTIFMYIILSVRQLISKLKRNYGNKNGELTKYFKLDTYQKLSPHESAIDAVYFNGVGQNGDALIVGTARRPKKLIDGFLYLKIDESGLGLLESPKLPGTSLYQFEEKEEYGAEGIKLTPLLSMRRWKIVYEGKMKLFNDRSKTVDVKLDVDWTSDLPYFNFDTDMSSIAMAKSMAYEKWSREYFQTLKEQHQTHYEQYGDIKGTVTIDGETYDVNVNALRDHSFGAKREWRNFHRYGLHFVTAENGDRFTVGKISMPICFSRLTMGYVYSAKDKKIFPVKWCDLKLYQHGENGKPPLDYAFRFKAGKITYTMQVNVIESPHFYISKDWESKVIERLCTFVINGVKGWGSAEWVYRNVNGKNVPDYT